MDNKVKKIIAKYGFIEDVELGKIPIIDSTMSQEEKEIALDFIASLIESVKPV